MTFLFKGQVTTLRFEVRQKRVKAYLVTASLKSLYTDLDCTFFATRGHPLAVGAEFEAGNGLTVAFVSKNTTFATNIP